MPPNTNPGPERVVAVERSSDSSGWAIAVIVLVIVIAGLFWWMHSRQAAPIPAAPEQPAQGGAASVNVTIPTGDNGSGTGDTGTPPNDGTNPQ